MYLIDINTKIFQELDYGSGSMRGTEYMDTVTLSPSLIITNQSIGVAKKISDFGEGIDGVLGIGPTDLTQGEKNASI
jgi:hypothetical protein